MTKKILFITIILSFLVRIYHYNYPPLLWDEASLGYNAYSLLKTGHDEYGTVFPYIFKSFGDYKPGLYVYLTIPFVALFGLNSLAVRLPSIILGSFIPLLFYLLISKLSPKSKNTALIAAVLVAFNPWNIHFSRGAWETNVLLFELLLGSYLFFLPRYFLSGLVFAATLYTYQGGKIMSPLIILVLLLLNYRQIFTKNLLARFILPLFILSLPILFGLIFKSDSNRLQVFGLWSYHRPEAETTQIIHESSTLNYQLFHHDFNFVLRNFFTRYFNHFSPKFLAFTGDWQIGRQSAPYTGILLFPTFLFFFYGLFISLSKSKPPIFWFFFSWLLIGPLPAALTLDIIQPVRTLSLSIPLIYFAAVGLSYLQSRFIKLIVVGIYLLAFFYYGDLYLNHMVKVKPDHWLYGYQQAWNYTLQHMAGKTITFTDFYGQPYIYYLFYSHYDPHQYQTQSQLITSGLDTGKISQIDHIKFTTPDFNSLSQQPQQLMIFSYDDALRQGIDLQKLTPLSPINGHSSFYAYETN